MKTTNFFTTMALVTCLAAAAQAQNNSQASGGSTPAASAGTSTEKEDSSFIFSGGGPRRLLDALQKQYGVDWFSVLDLPQEMQNVQIPKFRVNKESVDAILRREPARGGRGGVGAFGGGGGGGDGAGLLAETDPVRAALQAVTVLYNRLATERPELGRLEVIGDLLKPSVVMFVEPRGPRSGAAAGSAEVKVKAFPLGGIPEKDWEGLEKTAIDELENLSRATAESPGGKQLPIQVSLHKETALLVVQGPQACLDTVESIVTAFHANQQAFHADHRAGVIPVVPAVK